MEEKKKWGENEEGRNVEKHLNAPFNLTFTTETTVASFFSFLSFFFKGAHACF